MTPDEFRKLKVGQLIHEEYDGCVMITQITRVGHHHPSLGTTTDAIVLYHDANWAEIGETFTSSEYHADRQTVIT